MITLIHGDDSEKIEKNLIDLTSGKRASRLDGAKIKLKDLEENLLGSSLFEDENIFVIENLFKNKVKKDLLNFISSNKEELNIILVERSKVNKRDLGIIKLDQVTEHLLPQFYFKFLDGLYPKNGNNLNYFYKELLKNMTAEQIFYSTVKRIRGLIAVKTEAYSHSEIANLAPWQMGKLKKQASFWREEDLIAFYNTLFEIEKNMKSSQLTTSLDKYIDTMIITELN